MEIVFAGFGGQGVLTAGRIVADIALEEGKNVTWMPAYGPTMRGGKAYSVVKYSDGIIGGPDMEKLDILVAMNTPSISYASYLKEGGLIVANSNNVGDDVKIDNKKFKVVRIPCVSLAQEAGNPKAANIVAIGAIIKLCGLFPQEQAKKVLRNTFVEKGKGQYVDMNEAAFMKGYQAV